MIKKKEVQGSQDNMLAWVPWNVQVLLQCEICSCNKQTLGFSTMKIEEQYIQMALSLEIPRLPTLVL